MAIHRLEGACHCGNSRVAIELSGPPETYAPRTCDCDFCRRHGASYLSDPAGSLRIRVKDARLLAKYRQGSALADCLVCRNCGVLLGVAYAENGRLFATVNCRIVDGGTAFAETIAVSPKALSAAQKVERWKDVWFSNVEIVFAQET